jgi:hypothetical protein
VRSSIVLLFYNDFVLQAKAAAHSAASLAKDIQDRIKQCQDCDNHASGTDKQLLKNTNACKLKNEMTKTKTSAFNLDGIDLHDNKSCDQTQVSVSVKFYKS